MIRIQCDPQGRLILSGGSGTSLQNPVVLTSPQTYAGGSTQPVSLDVQGGLILATGLRTAPVSCTSACTTFGTGAAGILFSIQTWPYSSISVDVSSAGVGTTITYQWSNDNTNWFSIPGNVGSSVNATLTTTSIAAGIYTFDAGVAAYFRAVVTGYSSGTVTAGAYESNNAPQTKSVTVNGAGNGSTPLGALQAVTTANNPYPNGALAITASNTGTTAATTATLAANATKFTYICGFTITADATTAVAGTATVTGTVTGTLNYIQNVGTATAAGTLTQTFSPCIPSSAINTGVAVISVAAGIAGATAVTAWGFQL
jgi:hypothetical protein